MTLPPRVLFDSYGPRSAITLLAFRRWALLVVLLQLSRQSNGTLWCHESGAEDEASQAAAGSLHIHRPVGSLLKGAALIPARADCVDKSDFARHTNAVPVHS